MDVPLNPKKMRILLLDVQRFYLLLLLLFFLTSKIWYQLEFMSWSKWAKIWLEVECELFSYRYKIFWSFRPKWHEINNIAFCHHTIQDPIYEDLSNKWLIACSLQFIFIHLFLFIISFSNNVLLSLLHFQSYFSFARRNHYVQ